MNEKRHHLYSRIPHARYLLFLAVLLALVWPLSLILPLGVALVSAFDLAVVAFLLSVWPLWCDGRPDDIRRQAIRDDGGQMTLLLLTALIVMIMLVAVGMLLASRGRLPAVQTGLLVATLLLAWLFSNLVYTFHYARLYYERGPSGGDHGGLDFPGGAEPVFADFVNFAFVIGMTCQTADIAITARRMRRVTTAHGLLAFIFNLGVLALTVNVVASAI